MPIRYQGLTSISVSNNNANAATIQNEVMLYNLFEHASLSAEEELSADNFLLGWDQYMLMQRTPNGFQISGVYNAESGASIEVPTNGTYKQVVTRGVSSCAVVHLAEGNRHFFLHCNISKIADVLPEMLAFIEKNTNTVKMNASLYANKKCDDMLTVMFNKPNLKAKHILGRGHSTLNSLLHAEIGVEDNGGEGSFFGDYFINDNNPRAFMDGSTNEKYGFNRTTNFDLFQLD